MSEPYLNALTAQLIDGLERVPDDRRRRHVTFLKASQNRDGGFSGREGGSDLYYTGFALRALAVLQALNPTLCERAGGFLKSKLTEPASVIDLFSLLVSCFLTRIGGGPDVLAEAPDDWPKRVAATLESFRTTDGGYAPKADTPAGSTYHSFLVALALQLLGEPIPEPDRLIAFVRSRRRDDGGYVEAAAMRRSGTNPTAAGVGVLQITDALTDEERSAVADFLTQLPSELEGGFRANGRIPSADLLSTFTASWTLFQIGAWDRVDHESVGHFVEAIEVSRGGFHGGLWDAGVDVEYTFYGLGMLALLSAQE